MHSGFNDNSGNYGGTNTDTEGSSGSEDHSITKTFTYYDPKTGAAAATVTQIDNGGGGGGSSWTTTGNAPQPPVDGATGGATVMVPSFRFDGYPEEGTPFDAGKGPVSIVGIVGRDETPATPGESGGFRARSVPGAGIAAVKTHIEGEGKNGPDRLATSVTLPNGRKIEADMIYGSSNATNFPATDLPSRSAREIAEDQLALILSAKNKLGDGEVYRVVLIGFSWGGEKAMQVATLLNAMVKANGLEGKVQIHLRTLDPGNLVGGHSKAKPAPWSASSWHNWSQDRWTPGAGNIDGAFKS